VVSLFKNRDDKDAKTIMMINPKILEHSEHIELDEE
jgi:peptide deformylase